MMLMGLILASAWSSAQTSRWQLGNPSLIIDLPGQPTSASPDWKEPDSYAFLVSAWRAESDDALVEASIDYSRDPIPAFADALASRLGGKVESSLDRSVSGYPALEFTANNFRCLIIGGFGRYWSIVAAAKTNAGVAIVQKVLAGVRAEKWEEPRWVPRSFGQTFLVSDLPYDLALLRQSNGESPTVYALNYNDIEIEALVDRSKADVIDVKRTFDGFEQEIKARDTVKDAKFSRRRIRAEGLSGDEIVAEFQEGSRKYKVQYYAFKHRGDALRLKFTTTQGNAKHEEDVNRMLSSLKASNVTLNGYETQQIGDEGLWLDLPSALDKSNPQPGQRLYEKLFGTYTVDVRVTDSDRMGDTEQLTTFVEVAAKRDFDAQDTKFERSEISIDGIAGYRSEGKFKIGDSDYKLRLYVLEAPGRVYVIRSAIIERGEDILDRIFGSMRIEPPSPAGYTRRTVSKSGITTLLPNPLEYQDLGEDDRFERGYLAMLEEDGMSAFFVEFKIRPGDDFQVSSVFKESLDGLAEGIGMSARIKNQKPIDGGIHSEVDLTLDGDVLPGDWVMVRRGSYLFTVLVVYDPEVSQSEHKRFAIINSIR